MSGWQRRLEGALLMTMLTTTHTSILRSAFRDRCRHEGCRKIAYFADAHDQGRVFEMLVLYARGTVLYSPRTISTLLIRFARARTS